VLPSAERAGQDFLVPYREVNLYRRLGQSLGYTMPLRTA
jgi:hypothetical protein